MPALQFTTGYSMVLNLLYTRTLEEARAFLDRSFAAYLGGQGVQVGLLLLMPICCCPDSFLDSSFPATWAARACRFVYSCLTAVSLASWLDRGCHPWRP